jgi:hypothetical protein
MTIAVVAALIGALLYLVTVVPPKFAELGRILFLCGALATLLAIGQHLP